MLEDFDLDVVRRLLGRYGVELVEVEEGAAIPFSYWGEPEAGIRGMTLYARADTPIHSVLHELCHVICMPHERRIGLARDAGGDDDEECAVCYLQVLLADEVPQFGRERCFADMDAWGYSFREGGARNWFFGDGVSARSWLIAHALIDASTAQTWRLRG
jgi:hypothetical protein